MLSRLMVHIDFFEYVSYKRQECIGDRAWIADQRDHRTVVVGVRFDADKLESYLVPQGFDDSFYDVKASSLTEVGDALYDLAHWCPPF
jgi:hypothetical protein